MKDVSQNHDRTATKMVYVVIMLMRNLLKLQYEYFLLEREYHTFICLRLGACQLLSAAPNWLSS